MIDKLLSQLPEAFKPFVPAINKLLPVWMEKLKLRTSAIVINDAEDIKTAAAGVVEVIQEYGARELRRVDMMLDGKPVTVLIIGEVPA